MKRPPDDKARLLHILQAIAYVDEFIADRTKEALYQEPMFRFAIERQLEIIGEATNRLTDALKESAPETEWRRIAAFRNFIVHGYFGVDPELIWDIATQKLEPLRINIERILAEQFSN